jgi:hypothetical protein
MITGVIWFTVSPLNPGANKPQERLPNSQEIYQIERMIKEMPYISEHLSSLRQEIADLRDLNARLSEKGGHTAVDQTALELRTTRLREIKQELSKILNRPDDPKVWWERSRRPQQA